MSWLLNLSLISLFLVYLTLVFLIGTALRVRDYRHVLGLVLSVPQASAQSTDKASRATAVNGERPPASFPLVAAAGAGAVVCAGTARAADGIGAKQNREYILESIIFPNKKIAPGFETLLVTLKNETSYAGILKAEGDLTLEINSPEDGLVKINKPDIKARSRGLSGMPEELRQVLTKQDVRNLVEFLSTTAK